VRGGHVQALESHPERGGIGLATVATELVGVDHHVEVRGHPEGVELARLDPDVAVGDQPEAHHGAQSGEGLPDPGVGLEHRRPVGPEHGHEVGHQRLRRLNLLQGAIDDPAAIRSLGSDRRQGRQHLPLVDPPLRRCAGNRRPRVRQP